MVREAIIMLEVEGYVEVRKGSGIHVVSNQPRHQQAADNNMEFANYGPFELLQARQLIESNIAEFAATQVTKQDIMKLMAIQEQARGEQCFRDSGVGFAVPYSGSPGDAELPPWRLSLKNVDPA